MDFIPGSDDEGVSGEPHSTQKYSADPKPSAERVYSDDEDETWAIAALPPSFAATPDGQQLADAPKSRFAIGKRPTLTGAGKVRPGAGSRRLVSSAVAARQAAARAPEAPAAPASGLEAPLDWSAMAASQPDPSRRPPLAGGSLSFVGRAPPAPLRPLPEPAAKPSAAAVPAEATASNGSRPAGAAAASASAFHPLPPAPPAPRPAAPEVASHRTDDGLNVVYRKRTRAEDPEDGAPAPKARATVNSGWGNNFVRIDMKKGRGSTKYRSSRHTTTHRRPGRGRWKAQRLRQVGDGSEFMEGWEARGGSTCYRCGGKGHWAKDCPGAAAGGGAADSEDEGEAAPAPPPLPPLPSLPQGTPPPLPSAAAPLDVDVEALCDPEALEGHLQRVFGFPAFRGSQLVTIQKILRGESCLSIMPTGTGKSMCYQLPALLLPGLTLVVSPLIALMRDQCRAAPAELCPAMLWSGQTPLEARQVLQGVENGTVRVLFISPERLGNPYLLAALRPRMPLPLVVIDEAHCVAEWGHSFRPAYFRLGEALQRDVSARAVLALTATATRATQAAVCEVLRIPRAQVLRDSAIRSNLRLNVLRANGTPSSGAGAAGAGWPHITSLFRAGGALAASRSSIVYCAWKGDADSLAAALTRAGVNAKPYHAGRSLQERSAVEAAFGARRLRVVVATVAFGMGVDIASVDAVVHATMPRSLEEYVQQIGRAGRDGSEATCYAHLADQDFISLRSLAYSGVVTKEAVARVLDLVFPAREEAEEEGAAEGRRRFGALNCRKLAAEIDMAQESIEALLGYLEAEEVPYLRVLPRAALSAKVSFYAAPAEQMAEEHEVVRHVMTACPRPRNGLYSSPTAALACAAQKPPGAVLQDLQALAQRRLIGFELATEMGPAFEVLREPEDLAELAAALHARLSTMLRCQVARLDTSYRALAAAAAKPVQALQEAAMREALEEYFARQEAAGLAADGAADPTASLELEGLPLRAVGPSMLHGAKATLRRNKEQGGPAMAALTLARVLHGTGTAATPRDVWSKLMGAFWGNLRDVDFAAVLRISTLACNSFTD